MVPFFLFMIFINKKVMNIKRILISEQEKKDILSQYGISKDIISEQTLNEGLRDDDTYTTEKSYKIISLTSPTNKNFQFDITKGTYVYKKDENKICIRQGCEYYLLCKPYEKGRYEWIIYDNYGDYYQEDDRSRPLATELRNLFCKSSKFGTEIGGGGEKYFKENQKCKLEGDSKWIYAKDSSGWWASKDGGNTWIKLSLPKFKDAVDKLNNECPNVGPISKNFSEEQKCRLDGDKTWSYAKDDKGNWWASKDGGNTWIKLSLPKFKDAVDKLNNECPQGQGDCKTKCNAKPLQPGQLGPQVQGWFFSRDRVCYEATGTGGFTSKEECEACKCSDITGGGQISEEECFKNYPCFEVLLNNGKLYEGDSGYDMISCGCLYGSKESEYSGCIFYCDGTAWCEGTIPGKGDTYKFNCNQNKIDMDRENPKERNVEKPKKQIDGGKDDGNQLDYNIPLG
jgi:hypothetical protein